MLQLTAKLLVILLGILIAFNIKANAVKRRPTLSQNKIDVDSKILLSERQVVESTVQSNYSINSIHSNGGNEKHKLKRRHKNRKEKDTVLKTSMKAKIITEKKYLKKDWCKAHPVRQHIKTKTNCHTMIVNQFCYGQCNSFFIPKDTSVQRDGTLAPDYFASCSFCKPIRQEWISTTLRCKNIKKTKMPRFITIKLPRIKGCSCIAVPNLATAGITEETSNNKTAVK